jgi:hypothetical protein
LQRLTDWHRQQAAAIAAAVPLTPTCRIRATGNSLSAQNDEPEPTAPRTFRDIEAEANAEAREQLQSEEARVAADLAYNRLKQSGELGRRDEVRALELQIARHPELWL